MGVEDRNSPSPWLNRMSTLGLGDGIRIVDRDDLRINPSVVMYPPIQQLDMGTHCEYGIE